MDLLEIRHLAEEFREGIERARDKGAISSRTTKTTLYCFPDGCCEIGSELLAKFLFDHGIQTRIIHGEYNYDCYEKRFPHTWLETVEGIIIDITESQYINNPVFSRYSLSQCYVGYPDQFHELFNDARRDDGLFQGFDRLEKTYQRFAKPELLYKTILQFIS